MMYVNKKIVNHNTVSCFIAASTNQKHYRQSSTVVISRTRVRNGISIIDGQCCSLRNSFSRVIRSASSDCLSVLFVIEIIHQSQSHKQVRVLSFSDNVFNPDHVKNLIRLFLEMMYFELQTSNCPKSCSMFAYFVAKFLKKFPHALKSEVLVILAVMVLFSKFFCII